MKKNPLILFHQNCPDGYTSAWLFYNWLINTKKEVPELYPVSYGMTLPDVEKRDVYLLDFSFSADAIGYIIDSVLETGNFFIWLDHHQTAEGIVDEVIDAYGEDMSTSVWSVVSKIDDLCIFNQIQICLDMDHSAAKLSEIWTGEEFPFVDYIEDRDLWHHKLVDTDEVNATITSYEYDLATWNRISQTTIKELAEEGVGIVRYRKQLIHSQVGLAQPFTIAGYEVLGAPSPYAIASDVAGELAKISPSGVGIYWVDYPHSRKYGARSTEDGPDVAALAEKFGGGGHKHASGFELPFAFDLGV